MATQSLSHLTLGSHTNTVPSVLRKGRMTGWVLHQRERAGNVVRFPKKARAGPRALGGQDGRSVLEESSATVYGTHSRLPELQPAPPSETKCSCLPGLFLWGKSLFGMDVATSFSRWGT